jgi:hypothetical protein
VKGKAKRVNITIPALIKAVPTVIKTIAVLIKTVPTS